MVLVLTACPERLRGHLTRWLMEVSAGVFVGHVTKRVRTLLWARVIELIGSGRALLIYTAPGEQRLAVLTHGHHWEPEDHEGVFLMRRPHDDSPDAPGRPSGWSAASRRRKYGRRAGPK